MGKCVGEAVIWESWGRDESEIGEDSGRAAIRCWAYRHRRGTERNEGDRDDIEREIGPGMRIYVSVYR